MPLPEVRKVHPERQCMLTVAGGMDPCRIALVEVVKGNHGSILMRELCRGYLDDAITPPLVACLNGQLDSLASDFIASYQGKMHNFQNPD